MRHFVSTMRKRFFNGRFFGLISSTVVLLLFGFLTMAFAVVGVLPPDAEYSKPRLAPLSQGYAFPAPYTWSNGIPNALADYYTYAPLSAADALKLGFPASCGNSEDCYIITAKRLPHNFELKSILDQYATTIMVPPIPAFSWPGGTSGLLNPATGLNYGWVTDTYGYGSGGLNWRPNYLDPTVTNPEAIAFQANPAATITGSAPPFFQQFPIGSVLLGNTETGIWHFPAPSIKGTKGRPIRIQWVNELPNKIIPGFDPTVDCSDKFPDCFPYNRIVTHVHGAHVGPESDGLAHASYNPDFSWFGTDYNIFTYAAGPKGTYYYPMDQEAATIWYHDHAVGTTHLNTNQGLAGFFPITDDNEKCLQGIGAGCTKQLPTGDYELGFALQDRVFYDNGQFAMPDAPVIDANFPTCDSTSAASRGATCSPLFMYVKHAANTASLTPDGIHLVPYDEATIDLTIPENAQAPVQATSATLEFFGNMPVVNGVVYGKYDVEPRVYRMRFIGGTDSRTWVIQLQRRDNGAIIPFWQIGSDQGLLNSPASRTEVLLLPGERLDMLVDFTGIPVGTKVVLNNLGPDTPYQGEVILPMNRSVDIPEIMEFNTIAFNSAVADVPAPGTIASLRTKIVQLTPTAGTPVRVVALEEIVDEYGRIMPTIDRRGYDLPGIAATEIIKQFDTEIWDVINTTADAHPMHLHQVQFQLIHRQPFTSFTPAVNDPVNGVFAAPAYTATAGTEVLPDPHDAGWKDTVYTPPGFVTRIIARFDLVGQYVWHCHILSHEEHDMMRPMIIAAAAAPAPIALAVPSATTGNNRTSPVTITPPAAIPGGITLSYMLEYKQPVDANWTTNISTNLTPTVTFPRDGVYDLRVKAVDAAITPTLANSVYVPGSNQILVGPTDSMFSPANNTTLTGSNQVFDFSTNGAGTPYNAFTHTVWVGTTLGGSELGRYFAASNVTTVTAGVPTDGSIIYVRLWVKDTSVVPAVMRYKDYQYTAFTGAALSAPVQNSPSGTGGAGTLPTYNWNAVAGAASYNLYVSDGVNATTTNYFATTANCQTGAGVCTVTQQTALPIGPHYWAIQAVNAASTSTWNGLNFMAGNLPATPVLVSPSGGASNLPTYTWNAVANAASYNLYLSDGVTPVTTNYTAAVANCPVGTGQCTVTQLTPLANGAHFWDVQAVNLVGDSAWGVGLNFQAGAPTIAPVLSIPFGPGATTTPTYTWSAVTGATGYNLYLSDGVTETITNYSAATANCPTAPGTCTVLQSPPLTAGNKFWDVQVTNAIGTGPWAVGLNFSP